MKRIITAAALLLTISAAHAAEPLVNVDCKAIAAAAATAYEANDAKKSSMYSRKALENSLDGYCTVGIGGFIQGEALEQTMNSAAGALDAVSNDPEITAALLGATAQGYLYASASSMTKEQEKAAK